MLILGSGKNWINNMVKYNITVLLGTARDGNYTKEVFEFVCNELSNRDELKVTTVDVKDHLFQKTVTEGDSIKRWKEIIQNTDGLIVVSPEYNHSVPGELKILLDSLYDEYEGKVAATVGTSKGRFGGARMIEHLKMILHTINFNICLRTVNFSGIQQDWKKDEEKYKEQINGLLEEVTKKIHNEKSSCT